MTTIPVVTVAGVVVTVLPVLTVGVVNGVAVVCDSVVNVVGVVVVSTMHTVTHFQYSHDDTIRFDKIRLYFYTDKTDL